MRKVREVLWSEVSELATNIARSIEEGNSQLAAASLAALKAIHARQELLGMPDPFLTESLADYTEDPSEAAHLYRAALAQSTRYPDEPTYTKRIGLATRLEELGNLIEARTELMKARAEAHRLNDREWVEKADAQLSRLAI